MLKLVRQTRIVCDCQMSIGHRKLLHYKHFMIAAHTGASAIQIKLLRRYIDIQYPPIHTDSLSINIYRLCRGSGNDFQFYCT